MPQKMKMKIKFNWKRIAAAALAGVLACSMLSGCKKGGTTGKNEIMYYFYGTEAPDTAMVMEKVNEKLKEKTGYTIKYKFLTSDNYDLVLSSGEKYDLISAPDFLNYWENSKKGAFAAITDDDLKNNAPYIWENGQEYLKPVKTTDGTYYGIPGMNKYSPSRCYVARGDLMDKYGIESLDTVDDVERYLDAVAKNEPDIIPFDMPGTTPYFMLNMWASDWGWAAVGTMSFGEHVYFRLDDPDRKLFIAAEQPESKMFSEKMKKWMDNGYFSKSVLSNKTSSEDSFKNGRSALAWTSNPQSCNNIWKEFQKDDRKSWDVRFYPVYSKSQRIYNYTNSIVAVSSFSDKKDSALKVVNAIYEDEDLYQLWTYGVEGVHYKNLGDGKKETLVTDRYWGPSGGIVNMAYKLEDELEFPGADELVAKLKSFEVNDPIVNMNKDFEDLREIKLALDEVYKTYTTPRMYGAVDDADAALEKEIAALKTAGIDKYRDTLQKHLDEYVANLDE